MKNGKRGAVDPMFGIFIFLIIGSVYLYFNISLGDKISKVIDCETKDVNCVVETSILDQVNLNVMDDKKTNFLNCPTEYMTFYEDFAESEFENDPADQTPCKYDYDKKCSGIDQTYKRKRCIFKNINKRISEEMKNCWNNFGKGQKRLFNIDTEDVECKVCTVFYFDAKLQNEFGGRLIGWNYPDDEELNLDKFMRSHSPLLGQVTTEGDGQETYYEYTLDLVDKYAESPYYDYDVNYEYAIVIASYNEKRANLLFDRIMEKVFGFDPNNPSGDSSKGNFIVRNHFIENDQITTICESIV